MSETQVWKLNLWDKLLEKLLFWMPLFFPLYLLKVSIGGIPTNFLELMMGVLVLVWLIGKMEKIKRTGFYFNFKRWLAENTGLFFWTILLVFVLSYSINVPDQYLLIDNSTVFEAKRIALGILKSWILIPLIYLLFLSVRVHKREQLMSSLWAFLISAWPLAAWAFYQFVSGQFITLDGRASGPFINANYLAMYLAPAVVLCWIFLVRATLTLGPSPSGRGESFVLWVVMALFFSFVLLITQSYGAILATVIALIFYLAASWRMFARFEKHDQQKLLKKIICLVIVLFVCVGLAAAALFINTEKWKLVTDTVNRSSSAVRVEVYEVAWGLIKSNPIFGIGLGQFPGKYDLYAPEILGKTPYELIMLHPHNTFLAAWLYLGIPGLLIFCYLIYLAFKTFLKAEEFGEQYFRLIGLTLFLVMLIHGLVDTYFFKNDLAMLFWLILAVCLFPKSQIERKLIKV